MVNAIMKTGIKISNNAALFVMNISSMHKNKTIIEFCQNIYLLVKFQNNREYYTIGR